MKMLSIYFSHTYAAPLKKYLRLFFLKKKQLAMFPSYLDLWQNTNSTCFNLLLDRERGTSGHVHQITIGTVHQPPTVL